MNRFRSDYKITRNQSIYDEHVKGLSYNKIGDIYKLSPQRVQKIISDFKQKDLSLKLTVNDSYQKRQKVLDYAQSLREKSNLEEAEFLFKSVIEWDLKNYNPKGLVNVYGHLRILYTRKAIIQSLKANKLKYLNQALKVIDQAESVIKHFNKNPKMCLDGTKDVYKTLGNGVYPILLVHKSSVLVELAKLDLTKSKQDLKIALKTINRAIKNLPGSLAHKAWPLKQKGEILFLLGKNDEALKTIFDAQKYLFDGYFDELKQSDGELKIAVWKSGLDIALAKIYLSQKKYLLAKLTLSGVLAYPDSNGYLNERKKEAKYLLTKVK